MSQRSDHKGIDAFPPKPPRLLGQVREAIRRLHYSRRTEESYVHWIKRFIYWSDKRHPADMGAKEVTAFLSHLATERNVAAATQNQALSALLFLYKWVLDRDLPWLDDMVRAKRPVRLPVVLAPAEVDALLGQLKGVHWLMASLLYGAGLRLMECLRLRVKDIDFLYGQILIRDGKGEKDRATMLPERVSNPCMSSSEKPSGCTRLICVKATVKCICLTHSHENIRARGRNGAGSTYSRPGNAPLIRMTA